MDKRVRKSQMRRRQRKPISPGLVVLLQRENSRLRLELEASYLALAEDEVETRKLKSALFEMAMENDRLMHNSRIDHLTGAQNRGGIGAILDDEAAFSKRNRLPLSIVAIDVDGFKQVNDTYGHAAGDAVLREIVRRFIRVLRPYDKVGRLGGDEMVVVLRGTSQQNALTVAERLRRIVEGSPFSHNGSTFSVTVSLGVAEMRDGEFSAGLLEAADAALYEAKGAGRNRVKQRPT